VLPESLWLPWPAGHAARTCGFDKSATSFISIMLLLCIAAYLSKYLGGVPLAAATRWPHFWNNLSCHKCVHATAAAYCCFICRWGPFGSRNPLAVLVHYAVFAKLQSMFTLLLLRTAAAFSGGVLLAGATRWRRWFNMLSSQNCKVCSPCCCCVLLLHWQVGSLWQPQPAGCAARITVQRLCCLS
jgi:hypothetical protein